MRRSECVGAWRGPSKGVVAEDDERAVEQVCVGDAQAFDQILEPVGEGEPVTAELRVTVVVRVVKGRGVPDGCRTRVERSAGPIGNVVLRVGDLHAQRHIGWDEGAAETTLGMPVSP